jgi:hypothetical protein
MKWRYQWVYRVGLAILCATAFWAVYASAQEAPATNAPAATAGTPLTFDLDHVGVLRNLSLLDEPLWKYLASLIYVVLAFGVAKFLDYLVHGWLRRLAAGKKSPRDELRWSFSCTSD